MLSSIKEPFNGWNPRILAQMVILSSLMWVPMSAAAQAGEQSGIKFDVEAGGVVLFQVAVPEAFNMGGATDTRGVIESLTGTILRDLKISGLFNIIPREAYLGDSTAEGMTPNYRDWFNIGTQGLIKAGYKISGNKVVVDLRLYSIDNSQQVKLEGPYTGPVEMPIDEKKLRRYTHGFVNEVIRFFTKAPGFFNSRLVVVKRTAKGKDLFMVSPDGLEETRLTRSGGINMLPSLGQGQIFFTSFRNGGAHLFRLKKGKATAFSSFKGLNTGAVQSPDGKWVATTLSKDGNPEIYLLDAKTGKVGRRLTSHWGIDTSPSWSPDGKQIAFVSDRHGSPQIWVMSLEGGEPRRITFKGDYNTTPAWSPKGDTVAFTARDERNVFDIFKVAVADGKIQRLTQNQGNNEEPTWSPDGRYLAFTSTRGGKSKLFIMTADGKVQTQISASKGSYMTPFWER